VTATRSVTEQVRRLSRLVVVALTAAGLASAVVLSALVLALGPQTERAIEGARSVRLAHLSMLDQQTALRAYLVTDVDRFPGAVRGRARATGPGTTPTPASSSATTSASWPCSTTSSGASARGSTAGRPRRARRAGRGGARGLPGARQGAVSTPPGRPTPRDAAGRRAPRTRQARQLQLLEGLLGLLLLGLAVVAVVLQRAVRRLRGDVVEPSTGCWAR
jgi:hypothetical protein